MPWPRKTSTCRSFVTISSGLCRLLAIVVLLQGQNHTSRWTRAMGVDQIYQQLYHNEVGTNERPKGGVCYIEERMFKRETLCFGAFVAFCTVGDSAFAACNNTGGYYHATE